MLKFHLLITILILSTKIYCQNLTKEQAVEDLKYVYSSIQNVHPDLFWYFPKDSAHAYFNDMLSDIEDVIDKEDLYLIGSEFLTKFNSTHLVIDMPLLASGDFSKHSETLNPLPLDLQFTSKGIYVNHDITGESPIDRGDKIVSINGNDSEDIFNEFQKISSSVRNFYAWKFYSRFFLEYYRMQFGDSSSFAFQYIDFDNGDTLTLVMEAISFDKWGKHFMLMHDSLTNNVLNFELIDDKKNGIITIKSFAGSDLPNYESFLKESFGQINENNVENLIIDIRDNPGGNTKYADQLINYFSDEPYQYERKLICKVSQERRYEINRLTENYSKEEIKDLLKLYNLNWLYDNPIGDTVVFKGKELLHYPKQVAHKFKGSVYLLINERVGSTAHLFAQAFKCNDFGRVIGQETGEATIFYGDGCGLTLPNSKLGLGIATKKFVSHCESDHFHGIKPDYEVDYEPSKLLNGEDKVLDFTIKLITK